MARLRLIGLHKYYGKVHAVRGIDLEIPQGEFTVVVGPSGCGKSTLLRTIAGLEEVDRGTIEIDGVPINDVRPRDRNVAMVFQSYALYPYLTVFENIAFGLRARPRAYRPSERDIRVRVRNLLDLVQLDWLAEHYPTQLSGGQRQRIALARALAIEPRLLLLDEPFGALDAKVRKELRRWLRNLHNEIHLTSVFVTHDQEEALEVADRVVVMDKGRIEQTGTPQQVYNHPQTSFVHEFIGESIILPVLVRGNDVQFEGRPTGLDPQGIPGGAATLFARPFNMTILPASEANNLRGVVRRVHGIGPARRVEIELGSKNTIVEVDALRTQQWEVGQVVHLRPEQYRLFPDRA
jgi:sulfate/thiosulfate transport system ATP-binding protein